LLGEEVDRQRTGGSRRHVSQHRVEKSTGMPNAVMLPTPRASATATANSGVDTEPIGPRWIGAPQPTSEVNEVPKVTDA
jgi:hypothetical protein